MWLKDIAIFGVGGFVARLAMSLKSGDNRQRVVCLFGSAAVGKIEFV